LGNPGNDRNEIKSDKWELGEVWSRKKRYNQRKRNLRET
jgi:hypothetical protein